MQLHDLKSGMIIQTATKAKFLVLGNLAMSLDSIVPSHPLSYFTFDPDNQYTAITHVYEEPHFNLGSLAPAANWWFTKDNLLEHSELTLIWEYKAPPMYEYPLYRKLGDESTYVIVKFTDLRTGIVVDSTSDEYRVGYESTTWAPHTHSIWEPIEVVETDEDIYQIFEQLFETKLSFMSNPEETSKVEDEVDSLDITLAQLEAFFGVKITIVE